MRITYDPVADAAYIYLTDVPLGPGGETVPTDPPDDAQGSVSLEWNRGRLVGVEVLSASRVLHADLLATATRPGGR